MINHNVDSADVSASVARPVASSPLRRPTITFALDIYQAVVVLVCIFQAGGFRPALLRLLRLCNPLIAVSTKRESLSHMIASPKLT
jgi:hypothetical protein